ncbi:NFU1 iron-sulfur cluster scaffold-like 1 [Homarus americanus]|uniref:NFU1 iron-sulfur cluster scaffold-like 1 n=1 Tax=Homarus americanus TaxID=6706 RepID=A0A8J5MNC1_HOMAM|nr:NFU1 iron-sulfur cluster scaffold-like 1 [Homarus americanus]
MDDEEAEWRTIKPEAFAVIMDFFASGLPVIHQVDQRENDHAGCDDEDDETVAMIKELLDTRIRPTDDEEAEWRTIKPEAFRCHHGLFASVFQLYIKLTKERMTMMMGSCTGCPSSVVTLKNGVQNMLQFYIPEVAEVVEVKDVEDDLIEEEFNKFEKELNSEQTKSK